MTNNSLEIDRLYSKAVHYLILNFSQGQSEYQPLPQEWLDSECISLKKLICIYFIKHGRGDLLDIVGKSYSTVTYGVFVRAALFFSLRDASSAPLYAVGNLDLNVDQRCLLRGMRAVLAFIQGSDQRAVRLAIFSGVVNPEMIGSLAHAKLPISKEQVEFSLKYKSVSFIPGDSNVVKLF